MKTILLNLGLAMALFIFSMGARAQPQWQIHEWGTFTALQDESGQALSGINTDDEPVPKFVHGINYALCDSTT